MDYETLIENLVYWSKASHVNPRSRYALRKAANAITDLFGKVEQLQKENAELLKRAEQAERERDAAIHDIFEAASAKCFWCKHQDKKWLSGGTMDGLCYTC